MTNFHLPNWLVISVYLLTAIGGALCVFLSAKGINVISHEVATATTSFLGSISAIFGIQRFALYEKQQDPALPQEECKKTEEKQENICENFENTNNCV